MNSTLKQVLVFVLELTLR